jgi:large subunit ribosomal protein L13
MDIDEPHLSVDTLDSKVPLTALGPKRLSRVTLTGDEDAYYTSRLSARRTPAFKGQEMKTISAKPHEVKRDWLVVDATGQVLGRLASQIASRLRGKHKAVYTPHVDTGDYIVVINVEKLRVTGNKAEQKIYYRHSGYPGGLYSTTFSKLQASHPERVLEHAVKGMLPKGPLGSAMFRKLKIYAGSEHPHTAQQPKATQL